MKCWVRVRGRVSGRGLGCWFGGLSPIECLGLVSGSGCCLTRPWELAVMAALLGLLPPHGSCGLSFCLLALGSAFPHWMLWAFVEWKKQMDTSSFLLRKKIVKRRWNSWKHSGRVTKQSAVFLAWLWPVQQVLLPCRAWRNHLFCFGKWLALCLSLCQMVEFL